ncbi:hypothetical protein [Ferrovibrio sp.]|uniref:hypothetical protein n=1 Tax=Ferrovibrio sp. TaxID=1917215 RepID=UPI0025C73667|nr:hypothetical protein [Ferrovibrio sp.]
MRAPLQFPAPPHRLRLRRRRFAWLRRFEPALLASIAILLLAGLAGALGGWFLLDFKP